MPICKTRSLFNVVSLQNATITHYFKLVRTRVSIWCDGCHIRDCDLIHHDGCDKMNYAEISIPCLDIKYAYFDI